MIFKVRFLSGLFKCSIKGTGHVRVIVNDKFATSLSLPNNINICSKEYSNDSDVYKIQIENIDAKDVIIGPVTDGEIIEIESWGDLDIIRLSKLFENNNNEILKLPNYIPKSVKDLRYLFSGTGSHYIEGIESWDVSHVRNMSFVFYKAVNFNQDISSWDVSSVENMRSMFQDAKSFNRDVSSWNVSRVHNMSFMFYGAENFNQDISSWDVSSVTNMSDMFYGARNFNQDISSWDTSSVIETSPHVPRR